MIRDLDRQAGEFTLDNRHVDGTPAQALHLLTVDDQVLAYGSPAVDARS